jgi:hypothetical protein
MSNEHEHQQARDANKAGTHAPHASRPPVAEVTAHAAPSRAARDSKAADRIWAPKTMGDAITPVLHGVSDYMGRALDALDVEHDTPENREAIVGDATSQLLDASKIVGALLDGERADKRSQYRPAVEQAAIHVNALLRFVRTRTPHKALEQQLMIGVTAFDQVIDRVGTQSIESRPAAVLSERASHTSELEAAGTTKAKEALNGVLYQLEQQQERAITDFLHIAQLKDHEPPPIFEEFLNAMVLALTVEFSEALLALALSKSVAEQSARFVEELGHAGGANLSHAAEKATHAEESRELLVKLFSSPVEAGLEANKDATHEREGKDPEEGEVKVDRKALALVRFTSRLESSVNNRYLGHVSTVEDLVSSGAAGEADLDQMAAALSSTVSASYDQVFVRTTKAWATYLAHSRLGTRFAGNTKVSDMRNYFGTPEGEKRQFGTDHSGADGVLSIVFDVDEHGARHLVDSQTQVIGLNSVLKNTILNDADHQLARVALPKEVHVRARFAHATIALDETNRIRDVRGWQEVERIIGETAFQFWSRAGKDLRVH